MIPFNKPYCSGRELDYIRQVCGSTTMSGNGDFTKRCHAFFEERYGFRKCLLCTSGTDALEMCAMLCELHPGDEVIVPSYTFVSSAIAFLREGANVIFADSGALNPNITADTIRPLITPRTRVIVVVHYAGVACDMDSIMELAREHNLLVVEDAAHSIDSYYRDRPLGSIGHLAAFSFHETKNINCGEGGMLVVNDERFVRRSEIIWEKGTNRAEFYRGMVNKYGWCDIGSSFLPSEVVAAFLWAQLESMDEIQDKRRGEVLLLDLLSPKAEPVWAAMRDGEIGFFRWDIAGLRLLEGDGLREAALGVYSFERRHVPNLAARIRKGLHDAHASGMAASMAGSMTSIWIARTWVDLYLV